MTPDTTELRRLLAGATGLQWAFEGEVQGEAPAVVLHAGTLAALLDELEQLRLNAAEVAALLTAVIDDAESQHPGGWGPDVTMVAILKQARKALVTADPRAEGGQG